MKKKLLTIATLPFAKAQMLKTLLEKESIDAHLDDLHLPEETSSLAVKVQIRENHLEKAFPILEEFLGKDAPVTAPVRETEPQILVPVDFSDYSTKAARVAFGIAKSLNAKMVLFHAYPNPIAYSVPFSDIYAFDTGLVVHLENAEQNALEQMETFLKDLVHHFSREVWSQVETEFIIKAGDPRDDIISYSRKHQVMVIIMGTQGKAGTKTDILGSVTAEIITDARVPVLAIPEETPEDIATRFHKILYATNFDEKDFTAIEKLMGIIEPYNVEIHCVHIARSEEPVWDVARLQGMKDILKNKYPAKIFDCQLIIGEDILTELQRFITEHQIDVIALTTRRRNMLARMFNPGIARKMLFHTSIPLLVFHS